LERGRPRHSHPETSERGVRKAALIPLLKKESSSG
jgi:hypothetical protein